MIERALLVVVNIGDERERDSAERLVSDVASLRADGELFRDILSRGAVASLPSWRTWRSEATRG